MIGLDFLSAFGNWVNIPVMFDSGADVSFFGKSFADRIGITEIRNGAAEKLTVANNAEIMAYKHRLQCKVPGYGKTIFVEAFFAPEIYRQELLGRKDFLRDFGVILDSHNIYLFIQ